MDDTFNHKMVRQSKVMVVGCGALGNEVLKNLVLMDVGNIVIVDFDVVEESNLNHSCLFSIVKNSVGRPKVEVAIEALNLLNPNSKITAINGDFCLDVGRLLIMEMDIVISCVDNRWTRFIINRNCQSVNVPWIDGGISSLEGSVKAFSPGKNCYACLIGQHQQQELAQRFSCPFSIRKSLQTGHAPTNSIIASIIGAIQVQEALKIVANKKSGYSKFYTLEGKILSYDGLHCSFSISSFNALDEECCEHMKIAEPIHLKIKVEDSLHVSLLKLKNYFGSENVEIILERSPFVPIIVNILDNTEYNVMLPAYKVDDYLKNNYETSGIPLGYFRQIETWVIDNDFANSELSLRSLGIPHADILKIVVDKNEYYIEAE